MSELKSSMSEMKSQLVSAAAAAAAAGNTSSKFSSAGLLKKGRHLSLLIIFFHFLHYAFIKLLSPTLAVNEILFAK